MIEEHKFGSFVIDGRSYLGDIKILDNRVKTWEGREMHKVKSVDLKEVLESNPELIVIGTGNSGLLGLDEEAKSLIILRKISLFMDKNVEAIKKYNESLSENKKVVALFHATC